MINSDLIIGASASIIYISLPVENVRSQFNRQSDPFVMDFERYHQRMRLLDIWKRNGWPDSVESSYNIVSFE